MRTRLIPTRLRHAFLPGVRRQARGSSLHALVGAYVLDALPEAERLAFERHLLHCEQCRNDASGLREATALLATATAVPPRPELRERTLNAAALVRQLPPVVDEQPDGARRVARLTSRPAAAVRRRPWLAVAVSAVMAALVATSVVLGLHASSMQNRLTAAQQRDSVIAAILGAHDATMLTAQVQTGGTATVVMSHHMHALVFTASGLTRLPRSRAYELWVMGPAGDTPAGLLPPGHDGMSGPMVVRQLSPGDRLGLTVESASGSPHPTSPPIVLVTLD